MIVALLLAAIGVIFCWLPAATVLRCAIDQGSRTGAVERQIAQDDGVHSVVIEPRNQIGAFRAHVECVVSAPRREEDGCAGVDAAFHGVHFDGRVVDVDNAADPPRHRLGHVILLGLANAVLLQER